MSAWGWDGPRGVAKGEVAIGGRLTVSGPRVCGQGRGEWEADREWGWEGPRGVDVSMVGVNGWGE